MTNSPDRVEELDLLDQHIQRCRDAVAECPKWSPAQAEWSRARDALLNYRDDLSKLTRPESESVTVMREALEAVAHDFETDFVLDGKIVDHPPASFVTAYRAAREALTRFGCSE